MKTKVTFSPYTETTNKYIDIMLSLIKKQGFEVVPIKSMDTFLSAKIIHLNWYESLYNKSNFKNYIEFSIRFIMLFLFKLFRKKIVWTMHNRKPHDGNTVGLQGYLMKKLILHSTSIIIHSHLSEIILMDEFGLTNTKKVFYVPHPNYVGAYGDEVACKNEDKKLKLLFLGAVKPYKNIELLIDTVKNCSDEVELMIAGDTSSDLNYKGLLLERISESANVKTDFRFISDDELPTMLSKCDLLVLPYSLASSLNSGSAYLAFSYGKTVVCPQIGSILDLDKSVKSNVLSYSYQTEEEHIVQLSRTLQDAITIWRSNNKVYEDWGMKMREYVLRYHNESLVARGLLKAYNS